MARTLDTTTRHQRTVGRPKGAVIDERLIRAARDMGDTCPFRSGTAHVVVFGVIGGTGELPLPANVMTRNLTGTFGTDDLVHSRYVTREGAVLMELSNLLK